MFLPPAKVIFSEASVYYSQGKGGLPIGRGKGSASRGPALGGVGKIPLGSASGGGQVGQTPSNPTEMHSYCGHKFILDGVAYFKLQYEESTN